MHRGRTAMAAAAVVAGAFALSACHSGTGSPSASASNSTAPSTAPATGATGGGSTGTAGGSSAAGASVARCHTGDLGYSWGSPAPNGNASEQQHAYVGLKNTSGHTCALHGFPGVDLVNSGQRWSLIRDAQTPATVTLRPGASTRFTVTFLPWSAEGNVASNDFAPTTVVITPPNETTSYDLPWRWGHVLLQDAATHPGTYVGPVGG